MKQRFKIIKSLLVRLSILPGNKDPYALMVLALRIGDLIYKMS